MDRKTARELLHINGWLDRSAEIVERGRAAYLTDDLLQEALVPMVIHARAALDSEAGWTGAE